MASVYPNRKDGKIISFKFKAVVGRDESGRQISRCTTWEPDRAMTERKLIAQAEKEAVIWERRVKEECVTECNERRYNILFRDFVESYWLPMQRSNVRASTVDFRNYMLKVIVPYFGDFKLSEIGSAQIESYMNYLRKSYKTERGAWLSAQTLKHHYSTLNLIFTYALKLDYIAVNPLAKVDAPKLQKHKVDALSRGEVTAFIDELEKLPLKQKLMYYLLLTTGVRRGECMGLQWGDIDFANRLIHVRRSVTYTTQSGVVVGFPKTDTGIREIPITDSVLRLLIAYKAEENGADDAFLFHSEQSPYIPQEPTYLTKHMSRFMKRVGLPNMSPHDLRHTCASLMLQSGADVKSVQDILGHADASTTLNYYARSNIDTMREAACRTFNF